MVPIMNPNDFSDPLTSLQRHHDIVVLSELSWLLDGL